MSEDSATLSLRDAKSILNVFLEMKPVLSAMDNHAARIQTDTMTEFLVEKFPQLAEVIKEKAKYEPLIMLEADAIAIKALYDDVGQLETGRASHSFLKLTDTMNKIKAAYPELF